jgi:hypothetical protein
LNIKPKILKISYRFVSVKKKRKPQNGQILNRKASVNRQFGASGGEVPRLKSFCIFEASASLQVSGQ